MHHGSCFFFGFYISNVPKVLLQVGTTSGYEREQEEFVSMCGDGVIWKCFGRDQVRCRVCIHHF